MNREVKFRGKRIDTGEWIYGGLMNGCGECEISDYNDVVCGRYNVDPDTVGQYTGLKDKNDKEIYEGDWLRSAPGYFSFVKYDNQQAAFLSIYSHPEDGEELLLCDLGSGIEVVGNIHKGGGEDGDV